MDLAGLNDAQRVAVKRGLVSLFIVCDAFETRTGQFAKLDDLLLTPPDIIARRCKVSPLEVDSILRTLCSGKLEGISRLDELELEPDVFTTGDEHLDRALGGGIRTGMVGGRECRGAD